MSYLSQAFFKNQAHFAYTVLEIALWHHSKYFSQKPRHLYFYSIFITSGFFFKFCIDMAAEINLLIQEPSAETSTFPFIPKF